MGDVAGLFFELQILILLRFGLQIQNSRYILRGWLPVPVTEKDGGLTT